MAVELPSSSRLRACQPGMHPFLFCALSAKEHRQRGIVLFTVAAWLNPRVGQPSEGSVMKRLLVSALLLGSVSVAEAQVNAPTLKIDMENTAQDFSATSAQATLRTDLAAADTFSLLQS